MIEIGRVRTLALATALSAFVLLAACGDGDDGSAPPLDASLFPVVLESDTRVVAQADGAGSVEKPVEPAASQTVDTFEYQSPDGTHWASFRDGTLYMREADHEPVAIAEIPSTAEFANIGWSPDGERLVVDASFEGQTDRLYVVNVDGSGLTNVAEGLPGDAYAKSWSPDGRLLAFGLYTGEAQPEGPLDTLYVVAADGSGRTALGEFVNPQGDGGWDAPQWSADGSRLAVLYAPGGGIRVFDTAGGPAVDLGGQNSATKLSWSPQGLSLAFERYDPTTTTTTRSIVIVDMATPDVERVLTEGYWPRWSPAGDRIAFKRGEGSPALPAEVYTIHPDGTGEVLVGDMGPEARSEITWSGDGTQVEFTRAASGDQRIYALDLRNGEATRGAASLSEAGLEPGHPPSLSPDGERVAFPVFGFKEGGSAAGWYVMQLDTGVVTKATDDARFGDVFWTNGTIRLALSGGVSGVYVADGGGSAPRLISPDEAYAVAWSPDGERLALAKDTELRVVTAGGTEELVMPTGLSRGSGQVSRINWSPDGAALLFETSYSEGDSYLYDVFVSTLDGSTPRAISTSSPNPGRARWSPDGGTIAFSRKSGTGFDVVLADPDGEGERALTSIEAAEFSTVDLVWSPDGSMIAAVVGQNDTYVVDVETGTSVLVATNVGSCLMHLLGWSEDSHVLLLSPRCALGGL
jgi:Tol biopolymer transport system component